MWFICVLRSLLLLPLTRVISKLPLTRQHEECQPKAEVACFWDHPASARTQKLFQIWYSCDRSYLTCITHFCLTPSHHMRLSYPTNSNSIASAFCKHLCFSLPLTTSLRIIFTVLIYIYVTNSCLNACCMLPHSFPSLVWPLSLSIYLVHVAQDFCYPCDGFIYHTLMILLSLLCVSKAGFRERGQEVAV